MKQRRLLRFHGLKRPRVRQTWNKYNLFNLLRLRTPLLQNKTFFQQKWIGKSMTRGYHGEHIKEYQWERMFSRRPLSTVNMDPAYMARNDGSEQATGRGSGRLLKQRGRPGEKGTEDGSTKRTPYMQMVFAPMERRLDISVFRALFASSARQARQFVLHGAVTVNGKKMTYPGYLLNPGDMFQVDVERVMAATGKPKRGSRDQKALPTTATESAEGEEADAEGAVTEAAEGAEEAVDAAAADAAKEKHMAALKDIKQRAQKFMLVKSAHVRAKQKKSLRKLLQDVKTAMASAQKPSDPSSLSEMNEVERELTALVSQLTINSNQAKKDESARRKQEQEGSSSTTTTNSLGLLTDKQRLVLRWMMRGEAENPHDASKPYATPWKPRDWMSPFAFIPRYLEVNQRICAAVYLRHPVARAGLSEVPTPFSPQLSQLAFNWYLRRG
ncbi:hypothetical protein C8A00DRAFT_41645 [Chaetomidium leptoderma]|uniref:RNA-binding S4 domain-containing protein n=1 Tax=Chaetomidium leptoderma TaxID=669021 RepID=A0AAN7A0J6_9PEZI|nr:hypothetical protein C8A00DRAFT_41645 [Chaetomidium leptoderma]